MSRLTGNPDPLDRFFDDYVDGVLGAEDGDILSKWLLASPANVDRFVRESFLHSQLFQIMRRSEIHAEAMATPPSARAPQSAGPRSRADSKSRFRLRSPATVAGFAALLVAVGAMLLAYRFSSPATVAQVSGLSADASFEQTRDAFNVGALLPQGRAISLRRGRLLATLVSGTRVVLEGPAEVEFTDQNELRLVRGRLGADIPTHATGLLVRMPMGDVVDLGTAFTLDLPSETTCRIQVFKGMVELRPSRGRPVRIAEGTAISYDAVNDREMQIPYQPEERLSLLP
ncbi:FecR domain-containing protein [Lacipirellula limnantheis]|uniref:FecR protein n=1 Tax=Lacipirellula limnantheis TaxID=2528024 RepID=A0A517TY62_9BACT|nr:FecR domain-containing protein [Lacipirellula limnantheis]QDT73310.1 FecR protein [Lacipirellula limnantheis]